MADPVDAALVFISFATPNQTVAGMVCNALEKNGIRCWVCWRDIPSGKNYADQLQIAIRSSKVVVLVFSRYACESPDVTREIQLAFENGKTVIPFRIENVKPEKDLIYHLAGVQWLDAFIGPMEEHLNDLVTQVSALTGVQVETKPRVPVTDKIGFWTRVRAHSGWIVGAAALVLIVTALAAHFFARPTPVTDDSIHRAIATKLHEAFDARGVAVDCVSCAASVPHVNVQVSTGLVDLTGDLSAGDLAWGQRLNLQLAGVKTVLWEVQTSQQAKQESVSHTQPEDRTPKAAPVVIERPSTTPPAAPVAALTAELLRARAYVLGGQEQMRQKNYVSAQSQFQEALDLDPGNQAARAGLESATKKLEQSNQ